MKKIIAKFNSRCHETGKALKKNEWIIYDYSTRKAYHVEAPEALKRYERESERESVRNYIDAQENAYFDNFCQSNNI